ALLAAASRRQPKRASQRSSRRAHRKPNRRPSKRRKRRPSRRRSKKRLNRKRPSRRPRRKRPNKRPKRRNPSRNPNRKTSRRRNSKTHRQPAVLGLVESLLARLCYGHPIMTETLRRISRALLSVSDKTGLVDFARALATRGVELVSTGGTRSALAEAGLKVLDVSDITGFPEMMDGRVKTLHPKVHGGLLAIRDNAAHSAAMAAHGIRPIDLLVVNLYPFEATVAKGADARSGATASYETCIENIDIGGPAMIRAAAKNHADVAVIVDA